MCGKTGPHSVNMQLSNENCNTQFGWNLTQNRGYSDLGDIKHIWWTFSKVKRLWIHVYALVNMHFHSIIRKEPLEALLYKPILDLTKKKHALATDIFMATKQTITKAWKTPFLSFVEVKRRVHATLTKEKVMAILTDTRATLCWTSFQGWARILADLKEILTGFESPGAGLTNFSVIPFALAFYSYSPPCSSFFPSFSIFFLLLSFGH